MLQNLGASKLARPQPLRVQSGRKLPHSIKVAHCLPAVLEISSMVGERKTEFSNSFTVPLPHSVCFCPIHE